MKKMIFVLTSLVGFAAFGSNFRCVTVDKNNVISIVLVSKASGRTKVLEQESCVGKDMACHDRVAWLFYNKTQNYIQHNRCDS
jgi:hypothetical protein